MRGKSFLQALLAWAASQAGANVYTVPTIRPGTGAGFSGHRRGQPSINYQARAARSHRGQPASYNKGY